MAEIDLGKFKTHYILPGVARGERGRLDGLRLTVLNQTFQSVWDSAGLPPEGELCIRDISVPVRIRQNSSDQSIVALWSSALAEKVSRMIRSRAVGCVSYSSHHHALFDFAISVSHGDYRRAWAWQLMGILRSKPSSDADAVIQLVEALCREPGLIGPTLQLLAATGALPALAQRMYGEQWIALARSATAIAGVTVAPSAHAQTASSRTFHRALRVMRSSNLLAALVSSSTIEGAGETMSRAIATLAILEVEPALLRSKTGPELLALISASLTTGEPHLPTSPGKTGFDPELSIQADATREGCSIASKETTTNAEGDHEVSSRGKGVAPGRQHRLKRFQSANAGRPGAVDNSLELLNEPSSRWEGSGSLKTDKTEESEVFDPRNKAFTQFGGILFLVNLLEALKLPDEILDDEALGARPLRWTLHALGLELVAAEENDAAVLALAGLQPEAKPPSQEERPITEIEKASLRRLRQRIIDGLSEAVDYESNADVDLVQFVCHRRAQVVADPAWIEIRLSLDDIATEIRRAGLDLDPGYVTWLGVVMRFVYE